MLDSILGSLSQAFRPNLGAVYVGVVSVLCWASLAGDDGPLDALSKAWSDLTDRPASHLVDVQSWLSQHSDSVTPVSWALLFLAAAALGVQGPSAFNSKAGSTGLLAVMTLVSLQESATLLLILLVLVTLGAAPVHWVLRRSELDLRESLDEAVAGLCSLFLVPLYILIVVGGWLFGTIGGGSPRKDGVQPRHLQGLTDEVRRIADATSPRLIR